MFVNDTIPEKLPFLVKATVGGQTGHHAGLKMRWV
jgi:hypothetical protein